MARTIAEIKKEITNRWMTDPVIVQAYKLASGAGFDSFSKVSVESIFFYCIAAAVWTLEKLFDLHKEETSAMISELKPHSLRWYVSKAKAFLLGKSMVADADYYDTDGMTDEEIEALRVIKYAAAVERSAVVYLKIATESGGSPEPVSTEVKAAFVEYLREVKDAGVVIEIVNEPAEHFKLAMDIYYNPMMMNGSGQNFSGEFPVPETIKNFIKALPFNGEYRNASLVDALQAIDGVVIPELILAETSEDGLDWQQVTAKSNPRSGYYRIYDETADLILNYIPYESL
jgi:hypothetical protein